MLDEHENLVGIAPLVVIPRDDLHERVGQRDAGLGVEDGGVRIADEVGRDDHILRVIEDALELALGGLLHRGADLRILGGLGQVDREVDDGDIQRRDAHGHAGQLAVERRDDLTDGLGSAGRRRDDVVGSAAAAAPILHRNAVHGLLRGGDGVHRGHETVGDAEIVVQHLRDRRKAVGRAGRIGHELHIRGIGLVVHAHDEHRGVVLGRGGHDDVLGAGLDVARRLLLREEQARGLDDVLGADFVPAQVRGVLFRGHADGLAVHDQAVLGVIHRAFKPAVDGVILEHVRHVIRRNQVVDADDLDVRVVHRRAEDETADAAKAIDANFHCHCYIASLCYSNSTPAGPPRYGRGNRVLEVFWAKSAALFAAPP